MTISTLSLALMILWGVSSGIRGEEYFPCTEKGVFPDPDDCQSWYKCIRYGVPASRKTCDEVGLEKQYFDEKSKVCELNVDCGKRPPEDFFAKYAHLYEEPRKSIPRYPNKVLAMYVLLADDYTDYPAYKNWKPALYEYQQRGANVLYFTFINPRSMRVPKSFENLAATRGTNAPGAVPESTTIMFSIGGAGYSQKINPWEWLTSRKKAENMAEEVATWPDTYGCDGVDINIEAGAGDRPEAGENLVHFIKKLRELQPDITIGQPTYGYPQIRAQIDVINAGWDSKQNSNDLTDAIGIMVYEESQSLMYVREYAQGARRSWQDITVEVPKQQIMVGVNGSATEAVIDTLANEVLERELLGIFVWFASVRHTLRNGRFADGLDYGAGKGGWDASNYVEAQSAFVKVLDTFNEYNH